MKINKHDTTHARVPGSALRNEQLPLLDEHENLEELGGADMLDRLATPDGSEAWLAAKRREMGERRVDLLKTILMEIHRDNKITPEMPEGEKQSLAARCASIAWDREVNEAGKYLIQPEPQIWENSFVQCIVDLAKVELVTGVLQDSTVLLEAYSAKALELIESWNGANALDC